MPAKIGLAIPSFTFCWVLALGDPVQYRRNPAFTKSMMPALRTVMCRRESKLAEGLLPCPRGRLYRQLYDWAKDLSGALSKVLAGEDGSTSNQFESLLNLFAVLAFEVAADRAGVVKKLSAPSDWTQTTLSQSIYKYEALRAAGRVAERALMRSLDEAWSAMLDVGATSFWEVSEGWRAFGGAGSLCRGKSAMPVCFYGGASAFALSVIISHLHFHPKV